VRGCSPRGTLLDLDRHEHVHGHAVLVGPVGPEPAAPRPARLAHHEPAPALGPRPRGERGHESVPDSAIDVLPPERRAEEGVRHEPRAPRRDDVTVLESPMGDGADDLRRRVPEQEKPHDRRVHARGSGPRAAVYWRGANSQDRAMWFHLPPASRQRSTASQRMNHVPHRRRTAASAIMTAMRAADISTSGSPTG
jgi:hypothetical protein